MTHPKIKNNFLFARPYFIWRSGKDKSNNNENIEKEEKTFNKLSLKLPFVVELSTKLQYYGLTDHLIFDMEELVDIIWK